jgi:hypothetical protein
MLQSVDWKFYRTETAPDLPMETYIFMHTGMGARIATARDTLPEFQTSLAMTLRAWYTLKARLLGITISGVPGPEKVRARVLYGRWMVDCPACRGANDVIPDEPIYLCSSCGWPGVFRPGAEYVPAHFAQVLFPADRAEIERILLKRKLIRNRNWSPGETIEKLAEENQGHGEDV